MPCNASVVPLPGESLDSLFRRFKQQVNRGDVLGELRRRAIFVTSGERERRKHFKALAFAKRRQARREE